MDPLHIAWLAAGSVAFAVLLTWIGSADVGGTADAAGRTHSVDVHKKCRLADLDVAFNRARRRALVYGQAGSAMTFLQYVMGTMLAGGALTELLDPRWFKVLSVGVLSATLINNGFKLSARGHSERQHREYLALVRRQAEDELFRYEGEPEDQLRPVIEKIRRTVGEAIHKVEHNRLELHGRIIHAIDLRMKRGGNGPGGGEEGEEDQ